MLILDTDALPAADRAEMFQSLVSENSSTSIASFEAPAEFRATMHAYELGPGRVFNVEASGNTLRRTDRMARAAEQGAIALALPLSGRNRMRWNGGERLLGPGDLLLVDMGAAYEYGWSGHGTSYAFQADIDQLAVPMDIVRRAACRLPKSPLYGLARDHIAHVTTGAEQLSSNPDASDLGTATIEVMRALILSAGGDDKRRREAMQAAIAPMVQRYIVEHLSDPGLSPRQIAAANGLSLRALYSLYASLETSLEQSILHQRLRSARRDLADPAQRSRTITDIAAARGFTHLSHFSRRFREQFGSSPSDWRAEASAARSAEGQPDLVSMTE